MIAPVARDLDALLAALRSYPPGGDRISGIPRSKHLVRWLRP